MASSPTVAKRDNDFGVYLTKWLDEEPAQDIGVIEAAEHSPTTSGR